MKKEARSDLIVILSLVLIAAFFRFYRLHEWPPGLWRDEAANGLEAFRVLDGDRAIFYGTREPMFIYLVTVSIAFLGRSPLAIRAVAAVVGTATIPATYVLVRETLRSTHPRARLVAALSSLWMATSYWHINFSRLGFRGVLLPLFAALTFYFLWRGWNRLDEPHQRGRTYAWLALSGVCLALTFYTYTPGRFLPLLLLPFLARALRRAFSLRAGVLENAPSARSAARHLEVFVLCFVMVLAPLAAHYVAEPKSLLARSGVTIFGADSGESLPVLMASNMVRQLGMFGFVSDPNTRHNPAGRPAFDLITLAFSALGLSLSLRRWRKLPYQFCVVWFLAMQIPAILTYPELPHSLRAIGALPVAYVFPALGMAASWQWLRARAASLRLQTVIALFFGLSLVITGGLSCRDYFAPQVAEIELAKAFDPRFVEMASTMNELDQPQAVWLLPVGPQEEQRMAYFVIDFLHQGQAPHRYVHVDEASVALDLTEACRGAERALLLRRTGDWPSQPWHELYADWRGLIAFLLDKHAQRAEVLRFDGFEVVVYQLPSEVAFAFPSEFWPVNLDLGQAVRPSAAAVDFGSTGSGEAWVALQWTADEAPVADYTAQVALVEEGGRQVLSVTKLLLSSQLQPTSLWHPGQQETDYYTFQELPQPPMRGYSLEVSLYPSDVDGGARYPSATAGEKRTFVLGVISASGELLHRRSSVGERIAP